MGLLRWFVKKTQPKTVTLRVGALPNDNFLFRYGRKTRKVLLLFWTGFVVALLWLDRKIGYCSARIQNFLWG